MTITATAALALTARLASIGFVVAALEQLAALRSFAVGAPLARSVVSHFHAAPLAPGWDRLLPVLLVVQASAGTTVALAGPDSPVGLAAVIAVTSCLLLVQWRRTLGGDGAEQLGILIAVAALVAFSPSPSDGAATVAAAFLAGQLVLSYATAGAVKVISHEWRSRPILAEILATHRFGSPRVAGFLRRHRRIGLGMQWSVIAFELSFPLGLLAPKPVLIGLVAVGLVFHLSCAVLMGLNDFIWPFAAAYPCLLFAWSAWSPSR
jgi:hypothetical protein